MLFYHCNTTLVPRIRRVLHVKKDNLSLFPCLLVPCPSLDWRNHNQNTGRTVVLSVTPNGFVVSVVPDAATHMGGKYICYFIRMYMFRTSKASLLPLTIKFCENFFVRRMNNAQNFLSSWVEMSIGLCGPSVLSSTYTTPFD